jgi:hypothetical protein
MAAEFYVLSCLHRLGMNATMTLGNQKAVDLVVVRRPGEVATIDVKGVAGKDDWFLGVPPETPQPRHFVALLSFEGRMADPSSVPSVWVVPERDLLVWIGRWKNTYGIKRRTVATQLGAYRDAWSRLLTDG